MLLNYLKITLASLWRRKLFSLLTLLSIALSLVVVTCAASLWNMITAPIAPEVYKNRTFFLDAKTYLKKNGEETLHHKAEKVLPRNFQSKEVYQLQTPEMATVFESRGIWEIIRRNKSRRVDLMLTDHNFFKVFEFEFLEGKPYMESQSQLPIPYCVISEELAVYYFGGINCVGQIITNRSEQFKVLGVVKKPASSYYLQSDIYYQIKKEGDLPNYISWRDVAFLCNSSKDKEALDAELSHLARLASDNNDRMEVELFTVSSVMLYLTRFFDFGHRSYSIYVIMILVVLIIPLFCLVDVLKNSQENRNHEFGVRMAFGASRQRMIGLLLVENMAVTLMGGLLGLLLSFFFFVALSEEAWGKLFFVFFHWRAFFYYISVFLVIGMLAGIIPAYRLSKQQIVSAFKGLDND